MIYPHLDLRVVSFIAGLWLILSHGFALLRPVAVREWARKFPRSKAMGTALLAADAIWALVLIATMDLGEFSSWRTVLLVVIAVATFLTYRYVDEFLAVRAAGMFLLLLAEILIEAAYLRPEGGKILLVLLAYTWVALGMIWVGLPYLMRDQIDWVRSSNARWKGAALAGVVYGLLLVGFGVVG